MRPLSCRQRRRQWLRAIRELWIDRPRRKPFPPKSAHEPESGTAYGISDIIDPAGRGVVGIVACASNSGCILKRPRIGMTRWEASEPNDRGNRAADHQDDAGITENPSSSLSVEFTKMSPLRFTAWCDALLNLESLPSVSVR